jgi:hypothetical protein
MFQENIMDQDNAPIMGLNQEQQIAADGFFSFLFNDEKEMGITGPGGTGKTHLMGVMIDKIIPEYFQSCKLINILPLFDSVEMTATTNKAAEVLSLAAKKPTSTVQSFLNLKVQEDYKTGQSKLVKTRNWMVHERKILFVDEGSMTDTPLYNIVHEGTQGCKIVWVGDHCQMAPVMEPISPIYRVPMTVYHLTQPMRTNIPELHVLNQQLRTTVETGEFKPIQIVPGIIDWYTDQQMELAIQSHFSQQTLDARILAYTNKRVVEYNDHIRSLRNLPDEFTVGEQLINNTAIPLHRYMLSVEEEVEILSIKPKTVTLWVDNFEGQDIEIEIYECDIRNRLGMTFTDVKLPKDRAYFAGILKWLSSRKNWSRYYDLKKQILDLRQRDGSTVYKAQGSSLDTVFIDVTNISTCHNPSQAARMLYVAASRARKHVIFYGELTQKYGGLIV